VRRRRIRFAETARGHIRAVHAWQREAGHDPGILAGEVEEGILFLSLIPGAGALYLQGGIPGLRRLFLQRVSYHLYYTFTEDEVIVRAFWHTSRGHGPDLA
jgi:hypothetical protein